MAWKVPGGTVQSKVSMAASVITLGLSLSFPAMI